MTGEGPNGSTGGRPTSTPNPDPTILTTEALLREVEYLKELISSRIEGLNSVLSEKFARADQQFELVERQRVEQKKDTKDAVDAALTAQKEAVKEQTTAFATATGKSEDAVFKQLDQLALTATTANESLRRSIDEVKERMSETERGLREGIAAVDAKTSATMEQKRGATDSRAIMGWVVALGVGLIAIAGFLIDIASQGGP